MIRVAVADDHPEMRVAIRLLLNMSEEMEIMCEVSNGRQAVDCVKYLQPDVLVMDINMPVLGGLAATKQITKLSVPTRVILISTDIGIFVARQAAAAGARGFIPKDQLANLLLLAIETVQRGEEFFVE